jgi:ferredoxin-NADP reductase
MKCTVVENIRGVREERPIHLIQFTASEYFEYEPGDLIDITIPDHPTRNRQFSIAGDYPDSSKDLIVRDAGIVGHYLCTLQPGDTFEAEFIGGMFHPEENSIWISSGSGLAPFRAALVVGKSEGCRYFCNIDDEDEKYEITGPSGDIYCIYTSGHEEQRKVLESHIDLMKDKRIYICGSARYVTEICSFLGDKGIDPLYIETDMYGAATD